MGKVLLKGADTWLSEEIINFIVSKGYFVGDCCGYVFIPSIQVDRLGIFIENPKKSIIPFINKRKVWIGNIYFSEINQPVKAWNFHVTGETNLKLAKDLALGLAKEFNVDVNVELVNKNLEYEDTSVD